ncbi:MAG: hypothetical protein Alis3KO_36620 [Aliiglaciecola sp.]
MTEEAQTKSLVPHIALIAVVVIVLVAVFFFFSSEEEPQPVPVAVPVVEDPIPEPEIQQPDPALDEQEYATIDDTLEQTEPSQISLPDPEPVPEPLDTSDATVKSSLIEIAAYEAAASLLVNDDLLRRFVVFTENTARQASAPNFQIVQTPDQDFRVYQQSGNEYIDAASFKRYTPYVDMLDSMDNEAMLSLYETYSPALQDIYAEIGDPDDNFKYVMIDAINHVLDTPEVPVPIEVYTESVMYKFKDERLENLTAPQKQLLRTGPENMRRIKAKLRELKESLQ